MSKNKPNQHPRLFKVGTEKRGSDNRLYVIVENQSGVKRWKPSKYLLAGLELADWYNIPNIKLDNWYKWTENLSHQKKEIILKIRDSYELLEDLGFNVIECILPQSHQGIYWLDYPDDYARSIRSDIFSTDYILIVYMIDKYLHLDFRNNDKLEIYCQHNITPKSLFKINSYITRFNSTPNGVVSWSGSNEDSIRFGE